jgi:hypothetical protein
MTLLGLGLMLPNTGWAVPTVGKVAHSEAEARAEHQTHYGDGYGTYDKITQTYTPRKVESPRQSFSKPSLSQYQTAGSSALQQRRVGSKTASSRGSARASTGGPAVSSGSSAQGASLVSGSASKEASNDFMRQRQLRSRGRRAFTGGPESRN